MYNFMWLQFGLLFCLTSITTDQLEVIFYSGHWCSQTSGMHSCWQHVTGMIFSVDHMTAVNVRCSGLHAVRFDPHSLPLVDSGEVVARSGSVHPPCFTYRALSAADWWLTCQSEAWIIMLCSIIYWIKQIYYDILISASQQHRHLGILPCIAQSIFNLLIEALNKCFMQFHRPEVTHFPHGNLRMVGDSSWGHIVCISTLSVAGTHTSDDV